MMTRGHGQRVTHRFAADRTNLWIKNALSTARSDPRVAYRDPTPVIHINAYILAELAHVYGQRTDSMGIQHTGPRLAVMATRPWQVQQIRGGLGCQSSQNGRL